MVGAASRRTTPAVFSDRPSKKPRGAAPHSTTQRQFERVGLKKQIWAAAPTHRHRPAMELVFLRLLHPLVRLVRGVRHLHHCCGCVLTLCNYQAQKKHRRGCLVGL